MPKSKFKTKIKFLDKYFCIIGVQKIFRSDNGFHQRNFKPFCKNYGLKHITGLPDLHTATGIVKIKIQTKKNYIKANKEDRKSLTQSLQLALRGITKSIHTKLGKSLFPLRQRTGKRTTQFTRKSQPRCQLVKIKIHSN